MATSNTKDPDAVLDFPWDFINPAPGQTRGWLADGETIVDHVVTVTSGDIVVDSSEEDGGVVVVWLSGGTTRSVVTVHIVTSDGREDDRSRAISIRDR